MNFYQSHHHLHTETQTRQIWCVCTKYPNPVWVDQTGFLFFNFQVYSNI